MLAQPYVAESPGHMLLRSDTPISYAHISSSQRAKISASRIIPGNIFSMLTVKGLEPH